MLGSAKFLSAGPHWQRGPILAMLAGLALAGCTGPWRAGPRPTESPETPYERGVSAFAAGQFGLATQAFQDVLEQSPESVAALNGLAATYDHLGRYDLAGRYYSRAMAVDPESPQTLNNIGYSYLLQGKFDVAAVFLRDAQQRDANDPAIAANRAIAEAALRASRPHPAAQWQNPPNGEAEPRPSAKIKRTTRVVQTLTAQRTTQQATFVAIQAGDLRMPVAFTPSRSFQPVATDTLPAKLSAPIGDTRMAAAMDRLPRPIAAAMADAWLAVPQYTTQGGDGHDSSS
jgi:tetratricopeptide (TPR) repeat protein